MNLYLVSQNINKGYDTFDSFICAAESEQEAIETHPYSNDSWRSSMWVYWDQIDQVKVTKIGVADPSTPKGVVLASFNAG